MSNRDLIRAKTVGKTKNFRRRQVEVVIDGEPLKLQIRPPSVAERARILKAAGMNSKGEFSDPTELQVQAVICCVLDDEGKPAYELADREMMLSDESSGWFDKLAQECLPMLSPSDGDARKNS